MKTHYETLGVAPSAAPDELSAAFRALGVKYHPDKIALLPKRQGGKLLKDGVTFADITAAYAVLKDAKKRAEYDKLLALTTQPCPKCRGAGKVQKTKGFTGAVKVTCPACNGTGKKQKQE